MWPFSKNKNNHSFNPATDNAQLQIWAPLSGKVLELNQVPDPVFANSLLGPGVAIEPSSGKILAPFDGEIVSSFPTGHAIGLRSAGGVECLIHCGIDTVELQGKGFQVKAKQGDIVKRGQILIEVDLSVLTCAGKSLATPVVITNSDDWQVEIERKEGEVVAGKDVLLQVSRTEAASQS